jgi:hypothetical protein
MDKQSTFLATTVHQNLLKGSGLAYRPGELVGIEIELEGLNGRRAPYADGWTAVADGSLRDGIEYISNGPKTVDQLSADLDAIQQTFKAENFTPVFSFRTSVHVHVNVQDLTITEVLNYYCLYTVFEAALLQMGGEERIGNVHCMPVSMTQNMLDRIRNFVSDDEDNKATYWDSYRRMAHRDYRYASCNWASTQQHGTLEFRSHRGTLDKASIMAWVGVLLAMRKAATTFSNPIEIVQEFSKQGLFGFSNGIFPRDFVNNFVLPHQQDVWQGLRFAQFIAFSRKTWPKSLPVKAKKTVVEEEAESWTNPRTGRIFYRDRIEHGSDDWATVMIGIGHEDDNHWIHQIRPRPQPAVPDLARMPFAVNGDLLRVRVPQARRPANRLGEF